MAIKQGLRETKSNMRKKQIMEAAMELFRDYGYANVSVKDICEKVNVSVGSLYNFYGSKENLLFSCIYTGRDEFLSRNYVIDEEVPFEEQLVDFFVTAAKYNRTVPIELLGVAYGAWITPKITLDKSPTRPLFKAIQYLAARGTREKKFNMDHSEETVALFIRSQISGLALFYAGGDITGDMYLTFSRDVAHMMLKPKA